MINERQAKKYCRDDISLIENYDRAIADQTQTWHIHHRLEKVWWWETSSEDLIEQGIYFNRPASELIFLTNSEHTRLHKAGAVYSEEHRRNIGIGHKGISSWAKGKHFSEKHKMKLSQSMKGKHKGKHWYNNGKISVRTFNQPDGFVPGRLGGCN